MSTPIKLQSLASPSRHLDYQKGVCLKRGYSGALKPDRLGLSREANKRSDSVTGNLGVLATHETSACFSLGGAGSTRRE